MRFKVKLILNTDSPRVIPINYQYPLSAAIYKILDKGDATYASFLHEKGYGKGYKLFTFSDLKGKFKVRGDRMELINDQIELLVSFHLPEASRTFVEGLFRSQEIVVADKKSKAYFIVQSILSQPQFLKDFEENEIISLILKPLSPLVIGEKRVDGNYTFLTPDDDAFEENLIYSWRNKISASWDAPTAADALLLIEVEKYVNPWRSRLVTIKAGTNEETKIRGFINFKLKLTAERRFIDMLLNAGMGLYSAQGMGCLGVVEVKQ